MLLILWFTDSEYYRIYDASYATGGSPSFSMISGRSVLSIDQLLTDANSLRGNGGFDCSEYGMIGILKAIELINDINYPPVKSRGKHHVIVLTDASAADDYLYSQVINEATANANIAIHMFLSGTGCPGFGNYTTVAANTGGTTVNQITAAGLEKFAEYISSRLGNTGSRETEKDQCHTFYIGAFVTKFIVLFRTSQSNVTVMKPDGLKEVFSISEGFGTYAEISAQAGIYQACVTSGTLRQSIKTEESIDMAIDFIERSGTDLLPTAILPVLCKSAQRRYILITSFPIGEDALFLGTSDHDFSYFFCITCLF